MSRTITNYTSVIPERTTWVHALTAVPADELLNLTASLSQDWQVRPKAIPQVGLGMLKLNDSAFEEPFYLGEFPLATAWLEVRTDEGVIAEGAAQLMDDRQELAEALALCDAILAHRLPGWRRLTKVLNQGMARREAIRRERTQMLAGTQVDFSLLEDAGGDDA